MLPLLLAAVLTAPKLQVATHANTEPVSIAGELSGTYLNTGKANTGLRVKNKSNRTLSVYIRFPSETTWRSTVVDLTPPKTSSLISGLAPGTYELAAKKQFTTTFWDWGPVQIQIKNKKTSKWTLKP